VNSVRIRAYAKVNLCLHVLGRRADKYHELRTIFQTITLHDTLELELLRDPRIELHVTGNSSLAAEPSPQNLVYRALKALRRELRWRTGVRAVLSKRIPAGGGLGGGSSDAAAALAGMLRLTGRAIPAARLFAIARQLGADVPFFLHGGRAVGIGRGDEIYPLPDIPRRALLVVSPRGTTVATRDAYQWLARRLTKPRDPIKLARFCTLCWSTQRGALENDFEAVVFPRFPRLRRIKRELLERGVAEAALAGSGSAVFGFFQSPAQARRAAQAFPKDQVFVCSTLSRAAYRRQLGWPPSA